MGDSFTMTTLSLDTAGVWREQRDGKRREVIMLDIMGSTRSIFTPNPTST
jgi:hypothetical protein